MSLILDALRGGRAPAAPQSGPNEAQTDAVLQTLGYGRFTSSSRAARQKRRVVYLVVGITFAVLVCVMIGLAYVYLRHRPAI